MLQSTIADARVTFGRRRLILMARSTLPLRSRDLDAEDARAVEFKRAVFERDPARLLKLFDQHPELSTVLDEPWFSFGSTAVSHAAGLRDRGLVDALIDVGADLEKLSAWENGPYSPLHRLVDGATPESLELADHLVGRGAVIDLHSAAGMGRADVIETILDAEPQRVSEPGPDGATPLHLAKDPGIAALLLDYGAEIDKRCIDHKSTAAMWATHGREDVMRFLVENGASTDLYIAALLNDAALAEEILGSDPEAIDVRVFYGSSHPHLGGGDKYTWTLGGADTPVELARLRDHAEVYEYLLGLSAPGVQLVQAARRADIDALDALLAAHPDVLDAMDERLVCDALGGSPAATTRLLATGANPTARDDRSGATALHHAGWRGDIDLITALLDGGADASIRDHDYDATPMGWASENQQQAAKALLMERHPPDLVDAAWLGDVERVRALLEEDAAQVDGIDGGRVSPLRTAAWCGEAGVVQALLEFGADSSIPHPKSGKTALDCAQERGHDAIVALLTHSSKP